MEPANPTCASSTKKVWLLFAFTVMGMLFFAGLYFFHPQKTVTVQVVTEITTNIITCNVTNVVTHEVEKIVTVPARIPDEYINARNILGKITNATWVNEGGVLFNMKDVRVAYNLKQSIKEVVSEDTVKAKFELALRRNNVPINQNSPNIVLLSVGCIPTENHAILCWGISGTVYEQQVILRGGEFHESLVQIWGSGQEKYGIVGVNNASDAILKEVENQAELFANDYLSANPK